MRLLIRISIIIVTACFSTLIAACSGGGGGGGSSASGGSGGGAPVSAATLNSIAISPSSLSLPVGQQQNITATGFYSDGSAQDITSSVTWASSGLSLATIGSGGVVTALASGTPVLSASLGSATASLTAQVTTATLTGLDVTPAFIMGPIGASKSITAMAHFSNGTTLDVSGSISLSSSNSTLASTASNIVSLQATGNPTVTVSYSGQNLVVPITIYAKSLVSLAASQSSLSMPVSAILPLTLTATYSDGSTEDVTQKSNWISANPSVVSALTNTGVLGQIESFGQGSTVITASYSGQSVSVSVAVTAFTLVSFSITPANLLIAKGININYKAFGIFSDGNQYEVTPFTAWSSSAPTVMAVSNALGSQGNALNLYAGSAYTTATITGTYAGSSAASVLTINPATLSGLVISPSTVVMNSLQTTSLRAFGKFTDGGLSDLSSLVTWTSSNNAVAAISNDAFTKGLLSSLSQGSANITATLGAVSGLQTVTVNNSATPTFTATGLGLTGQYYSNMTLASSGYVGSRIDSTVDFNWASNAAPLGLGTLYSIKWTGYVQAVYSQTYTFCTYSDDGIRLWVNSVELVNNWVDHAVTENCGTIALTAGQKYPIEIDYYQNGGVAEAELYWQSSSQAVQPIPQQYLYDH